MYSMNMLTLDIAPQQNEIRTIKPMFNSNLFNKFIEYTDVKETTIKGYQVCIRQFIKWLYENNIHQPTREDIRAYKDYVSKQNFTAGTKSQYLRAVKHFFKWTNSEGLYPNIADNIKGVKVKHDNTKKEAFTEDDVKIILNSIDRTTEQGKRDYAMILLAITGGLRIIEIQRADIQDIQVIKGQNVIYIQGKGRDEKDEYIKIIAEVKEAIEDYLITKPAAKRNDPLFTGTSNRAKGQRMTEPSISRLIKSIFKKAGYDSNKLTAHSLRHTSNTLLFKSGADLYKVQQHARHQDPKTTEIYLHAVDREKDTSEQDIYNQIFKPNEINTHKEILKLLETLNHEQQVKLLNYIKTL